MKYNVGDKVKVRKDLEVGKRYDKYCFTSGMTRFSNRVLNVEDKSSNFYILTDGEGAEDTKYFWTDGMLEPVVADFKVKCIRSGSDCFDIGEEYEVINGRLRSNNGGDSVNLFSNLMEINEAHTSQFELVEESEPVESVVTEDEPKFKVGDIVHHCNDSKGYNKVVESISINSKYPYECRDLRGNQAFDWYSEKELTLVGEKTSEPDYKTMFENCKKQLGEAFDEIEKLESKKVIPTPDFQPLYKKAKQELSELKEKNIGRDNYAKIGKKLFFIVGNDISFETSKNTDDLIKALPERSEVNDKMIDSLIEDFLKHKRKEMSDSVCKEINELTSEITKLTEVNKSLVCRDMNNKHKIKMLNKCLKKQYKFIDKLLPERIEV